MTDSEGKITGVSGTAKGQETTTSTDSKSETSVTEESKTDTEYGDKKDVSPDPEESAEVETDKSSQKEKLTEEEIRGGTGDVTVTLNPGDKDKVAKKDTDEEALLGVLPKLSRMGQSGSVPLSAAGQPGDLLDAFFIA